MAYQDDEAASSAESTSTEVATTNGGDKKPKTISVEISTLFSNESKSVLRMSIWNGKLGFEFSKPDGDKSKRAFFTMDYEKAIFVSGLLNSIARDRVNQHRQGAPYTELLIPIEQTYIKDGEVHKVGTFFIKTIPVKSDNGTTSPRVAVAYESVGETYEVVLASRIISKQCTDKWAMKEIDADDARFFLLCKTLESTINNLPVLAFIARLADIIFTRPSGGGNGGNFPKKEWNNKGGFNRDKPQYGGSKSSAFGGDRSNNRVDDVETINF